MLVQNNPYYDYYDEYYFNSSKSVTSQMVNWTYAYRIWILILASGARETGYWKRMINRDEEDDGRFHLRRWRLCWCFAVHCAWAWCLASIQGPRR